MKDNKRKKVVKVTLNNGDEIYFTPEAFNMEKLSKSSNFKNHIKSVTELQVSVEEYNRLVGEPPF